MCFFAIFLAIAFMNLSRKLITGIGDLPSNKWHSWCDCDCDYQFEQLVSSLIPKSDHHYDDFFPEAGRAVILASLLKYQSENSTDIEKLVDDLLMKNVEELYHFLGDTQAKIYVDPKGERTAVSIRATIAKCIRHFNILRNTDQPFSTRDWILSKEESNQWFFITCNPDQRRSLNPLMSVWFSIAMNAMKTRSPEDAHQRTWFIIDELHSLQKLEYLEESLSELRKYGGCIVLATQNVSQLDKLYGQHGARVILDQCGTKVSFRQSDADIAKRMSSFFGQHEFRETKEGLSYGAHEMRDGVNLSSTERTKATVSPTQILNLSDLEAFIKLPGNWPALKTKFRYSNQKGISKAYIKNSEMFV
ncbi:MAG: Coupling protein TraD [Chlamydiae bacterium]|nr:Coupling protein TraD [Chlamydiota bacterium]